MSIELIAMTLAGTTYRAHYIDVLRLLWNLKRKRLLQLCLEKNIGPMEYIRSCPKFVLATIYADALSKEVSERKNVSIPK